MTGERVLARLRDAPQPGGRDPAPGELALVQSFINSHYDLVVEHGRDLLSTPTSAGRWLADRQLLSARVGLTSADVRRLISAREGLRALADANNGPRDGYAIAALNGAAQSACVEIGFGEDGPHLVAAGRRPLDRALGTVFAIAATSMIDGSWSRLKACPGDDCGWAFYDHSRNQSGRWCSMAVCGGRAKARSHYHRYRGTAG